MEDTKVVELLDSYYKKHEPLLVTIKDEETGKEFTYHLKRYLSINERISLINNIIDSCFDEEGIYLSELFEPIFDTYILQALTDVPVIKKEIESDETENNNEETDVIDLQKSYDLFKSLNVFSIKDANFAELYWDLNDEVKNKIYEKQKADKNKIYNDLADIVERVKDFINKAIDKIESIDVDSFVADVQKIASRAQEINSDNMMDILIKLNHSDEKK